MLQQPRLCGLSARARSRVTLRKMPVKFFELVFSHPPPPQWGDGDLNGSNSGCACLGSGVVPPLGVVEKEVAVLIVLVRRHRRAVGAAVRRAVDDETPGTVLILLIGT